MRATIYIKDEQLEQWQALENKSQWVHDMLSGDSTDLDRRIRKIVAEVVAEELAKRESGY